MGDDGVGIYVVRILKGKIPLRADVEFKELSLGGLRLVEEILGYESVFIIDSIASSGTVGRIREFTPQQFKGTQYVSSPHDTNFATALELYKKLEANEVPKTIRIFTLDISPEFTFTEALSPPVQRAALELAERIALEVEQIRN